MSFEKYECDGQIELLDYMAQLEAETKKCLDCIYYKDFKCVRSSCYKLVAAEGWNPLWYDTMHHVYGKWPTCENWQDVETVCEGKEIIICQAKGKDKTFKWPKDTPKHFDDQVIAWRYVGVSL